MKEKKAKNTKKGILIGCGISALLLVGLLSSYAFFTITASNKNEEVNVQTGTLALTFADGNDAITEALEFGGSIEKTFTIENTGTLDAWAKINFEDLVNTYLDGSLTYTLSYSENENGEYTDLITNKNVPRSETSSTKEIIDSLSIPAGVKYFYKLKITLNYLEDTDQTNDLNAIFSTHFKLEQGSAKYTITFDDGNGENITKDVIENTTYGELPTPTKAGHTFVGWFTEPNGQGTEITSETTVNIKSNQTLYAHFKEIFTKSLIVKSNDASITSYASGVKGEMYTFSHSKTSQTPALTDYRYIGNVPNNYINFNNETWRIIGVFSVQNAKGEWEERIKIIRENSIGKLKWNSSQSNEWPGSALETILNGSYYNRTGTYSSLGLTETAKKQIDKTVYYLGAATDYQNVTSPSRYLFERGNNSYNNSRSLSILQFVGLIYASDYTYTFAYNINNVCFTDGNNCKTNTSGEPQKSWLFNSQYYYSISTRTNSNSAFYVTQEGRITSGLVTTQYEIRPCVYLRPDIEITSGDGTSAKPYILKVPTD